MEHKNKNMIVLVIVIILLVVGAIFIFAKKDDAPAPADTSSEIVAPEGTEDTTEGSQNVSAPATLKYADALKLYSEKRIQLDKVCQAHPNNVTYKNGTSIMIDNRSPQSAKVHLSSVFTIKPYGFKIVKLSATKLPATILVDCGTSQNVATILVQK
jgi:hypothetical protein